MVVALADVVALVVGETCYMHQLVGMGGQYQQVTEIGNFITHYPPSTDKPPFSAEQSLLNPENG